MNTYPYIIKHVQLKELDNISVPDTQEKGYYFVFWHNDIPVGDLYLKRFETYSEQELKEKIVQKTQTTLDHYKSKGFLIDKSREYSSEIKVSVVICTRNRSLHLQKCLDSFRNQKKRSPTRLLL